MRTVGVVTTARSDYGYYLPVLQRFEEDPDIELKLIVAGSHFSPEQGSTVEVIEGDGFKIAERVEMLLDSNTPEGVSKSMGLGTIGFAQAFSRLQPDILLVHGDRFEMHAAVVAAVPFLMPTAHIDGGAVTEGAMDDAFRHSITKMSHLHFAETESNARRLIQMGEEPWRVTVCGAASLDNLHQMPLLSRQELADRFGIDLTCPSLLVTYHPVTLEQDRTEMQVKELLAALEELELGIVFTYPNADPKGRSIIDAILEFTGRRKHSKAVANLGTQAYFSLMSHAAAMVGNSSSGIVEAASFGLPVVNIGTRERGRVHGRNVLDVGYGRGEILQSIRRAVSPEFRASLEGLTNPYGDGHASEKIVARLKEVTLDSELLRKRFYEN